MSKAMSCRLDNGDKVEIQYEGQYRKPYPECCEGIRIGPVDFDRGWLESEMTVEINGKVYQGIRYVLLKEVKEAKT